MSLIHWATLAAACVQRETWCIFTRQLKKVDCQVLFSVLVGKRRLLTEQMCVKARFLNKVTEGNKHPFGSVCSHSASSREALANKSAQSGRLCPAVCSTASTKTTEWPQAQGCDNMNDSANNPYSKLQWNGAIIKSKWIVKYCGVVLSLSVCLNSVMASGRQQWPWSHLKYVSHVINVKITVLSQRKHDSSAAKWTFTRCSGKHLRESTRIPRIW